MLYGTSKTNLLSRSSLNATNFLHMPLSKNEGFKMIYIEIQNTTEIKAEEGAKEIDNIFSLEH